MDKAPVIPTVKLQVTIQELDFIVGRLTAGQMDFPTSQNVSAMLVKLQNQANDPTIQGSKEKP